MISKKQIKEKAYEFFELLKDYNTNDAVKIIKKLKKVYRKELHLLRK